MAMRQPGTETDPLMYEDITLAYLSNVVDYFTSYDHESAQDLGRARTNCEGDQRFGVEKYAAVAVPRDHIVLLANTGPIGISRLIGCPHLVRNYPSDRRWKDDVYGYNHIHAHEHRPSESTVGLYPTRVGWARERVDVPSG